MPAKDDKVFDVAKPGKSGPSPTSKPVIVGHKSMIEDPMVKKDSIPVTDAGSNEAADNTQPTSEKPELSPHEAKTVMPLSDAEKVEEKPAATAEDETKPTEPVSEAAPAPAEPTENQEAAVSDSVPDEPEKTPKPTDKDAKAAEEEKARQEAIQKLIESKQYVVHVGESHHRKSRKGVIIVLLVLLLVVVGADLAVDAGYIDVGFKPPVDLIKD